MAEVMGGNGETVVIVGDFAGGLLYFVGSVICAISSIHPGCVRKEIGNSKRME